MKKRAGFSMVELVITVIVVAIVMYAVIAIFITSGVKGVNVDVFTVAQSLAENKLEEAMAQTFDDVTDEAQTDFSGDLDDYSYEIAVVYVTSEALDTAVASPSAYKKIQVKIRHDQLAGAVSLEAIRANY
jgi:type II secretory pathway pseudopilin PulG